MLTVPLSKRIRDSNLPVAYIYSRHVLPKPVDWTAEEMVVGPLFDELDLAPEMETAYTLPADLRAYIDRAKVDKMPIVYIGLGSMLGTLFEDEQISKILNQIAEGAVQAQVKTPCRVIVHTVTGKPKPGAISYRPNGSGDDKAPAYFALNHAVPHRHLFSQCEYIVTHGGAGTMQAALLAGVPSSAIACGPTVGVGEAEESTRIYLSPNVRHRPINPSGPMSSVT